MLHEDELIADLTDVLEELATDGSIELVTKNGPSALAAELALVLEQDPDVDLEEWLLDRDEVVEVFVDRAAALTPAARPPPPRARRPAFEMER